MPAICKHHVPIQQHNRRQIVFFNLNFCNDYFMFYIMFYERPYHVYFSVYYHLNHQG